MKSPKNMITLFILISLLAGLFSFSGLAAATDAEQGTGFAVPVLIVNTSFLNVRVGPSVDYAVLITVVGGTELPVLAIASDNVWYQVNTVAGVGWVNVTFTLPRGSFRHVPVMRLSDIHADLALGLGQGGGAVTDADAPGTTATSSAAASGRTWGARLISGVTLRTGPSDDSTGIGLFFPDPNSLDVYPIINQFAAFPTVWYQIVLPEVGAGWVKDVNITVTAMGCTPDFAVAYVLAGADLKANPDGTPLPFPSPTISEGNEVYIVGYGRNNQALIERIDGVTGWVGADVLQIRSTNLVYRCDLLPAGAPTLGAGGGSTTPGGTTTVTTSGRPSGPHVVVNTGNLNIRSGPAVGFSVVATVPGGTQLSVVGRAADGVWFLVEGDFGQGWLNNQFTLFRGSYSSVPVVDVRAWFNN